MITDKAKESIIAHLKTTYTKMVVGSGGDTTNPSSTVLDIPIDLSAVNLTAYESGNSVEFEGFITGASLVGHNIKEVGIYNAGLTEMLTRIPFENIGPFTSTDSLEINVIMVVE
tara:strand:- start:25890 stop:26231 length:342 start_codon:yes stop_codon:yes gene_type:complete